MVLYRGLMAGLLLISATYSVSARSILEKKMYYVSTTNKVAEAKFWAIYLGNQSLSLSRKLPGEAESKINASVNFQLLSSGYIEGNGYGSKGKIEALPTMAIRGASGDRGIALDSIDFVYDAGRRVRLLSGEDGEFLMDIEGNLRSPNQFLLREYKLVDYYGEQILKEGSEETNIAAISFTKEGAQRALKASAAK